MSQGTPTPPAMPFQLVVDRVDPNLPTEVRGVTCYGINLGPNEALVKFPLIPIPIYVPIDQLKVIGPEGAIPNLQGCGVGQGANCCVFFMWGKSGPVCERHGALREALLESSKRFISQRQPQELYPKCMLKLPEALVNLEGEVSQIVPAEPIAAPQVAVVGGSNDSASF